MSIRSIKSRVRGQAAPSAGIAGLLCVVSLVAGCASLQCAPLKEPLETAATQGAAITVEADTPASEARVPPKAAAGQDPVGLKPERAAVEATREPDQVNSTPSEGVAFRPAVPPVEPSVNRPTEPVVAKVELPAVKTPVEVAATPVPKVAPATTVQVQKKAIATPGPAKPETAPPLDMKSLETRLKETNAIGLFTKITLKNQVDDLLKQFRAFYQGQFKGSLAELRRTYDSLLLKVISLLRDADPPLAHAIVASREAIWSILADPAKFATL